MTNLFKKLKLIDEQEIGRLVEKRLKEYDPGLRSLANMYREMDGVMNREDLAPEEKLALYKTTHQRFSNMKAPKPEIDIEGFIPEEEPPLPGPPPPPPVPQPHLYQPIRRIPLPTSPTPNTPNTALSSRGDGSQASGSSDAFQTPISTTKLPRQKQVVLTPAAIGVSSKFDKKFTALMKLLENSKDLINSDPQSGELVLGGKPVPNTNYKDLVGDLYQQKDKYNLTGKKEFHDALLNLFGSEQRSPDSMVSRKDYQKSLNPWRPKNLTKSSVAKQGGNGLGEKKHKFSFNHSPPGRSIKVLHLY